MNAHECIFCKIAAGEIPARFVHRGQDVIAIEDVNPQAPRHVLVMPVAHYANISEYARQAQGSAVRELMQVASEIGARDAGGYRLVVNTGEDGGQTVGHLHVHVLAGRTMAWPPG